MKSSKKRSRRRSHGGGLHSGGVSGGCAGPFQSGQQQSPCLTKGAAFEFSYNITAQDSASTPALYNILKQVGATSGDVAGLYSPGQLQLYLYPSGGLARAETGGTDFSPTSILMPTTPTSMPGGSTAPCGIPSRTACRWWVRSCRSGLCPTTSRRPSWQRSSACPTRRWPCRRCPATP